MSMTKIVMLVVGFLGLLSVFWIGFHAELTLGMSFLAIPMMLLPSLFLMLQALQNNLKRH
ncbi:MAG: hypothetical protein HWE10_08530 [Gammaproteobacteria bacterium]|nr:hypothetical protein [Gammaproteobacteria bacterium]